MSAIISISQELTLSMFSSLGGLSQMTPTPSCRDIFTAGTSVFVPSNGSMLSIDVVMLSTFGDSVLMMTPGMMTSSLYRQHISVKVL